MISLQPFFDYIFKDEKGVLYPKSPARKAKFVKFMKQIHIGSSDGKLFWNDALDVTTILHTKYFSMDRYYFHVIHGNILYRGIFSNNDMRFEQCSLEHAGIPLIKSKTITDFKCIKKDFLKYIIGNLFDLPIDDIWIPDEVNMYINEGR